MADQRINLSRVFASLQKELAAGLDISHHAVRHSGTKGDVSELNWVDILEKYLPKRYQVSKAFVIDSKGHSSDQIDVVIHDRQYSPFLLNYKSALYVPAESVYAVFEVKPDLNSKYIRYAGAKARSVRTLARTSIAITHAGGKFKAKRPSRILAGILCSACKWKAPFGEDLVRSLARLDGDSRLDLGCVITSGGFDVKYPRGGPRITASQQEVALVFFFLRLIKRLQAKATVPALNVEAYAKWL